MRRLPVFLLLGLCLAGCGGGPDRLEVLEAKEKRLVARVEKTEAVVREAVGVVEACEKAGVSNARFRSVLGNEEFLKNAKVLADKRQEAEQLLQRARAALSEAQEGLAEIREEIDEFLQD